MKYILTVILTITFYVCYTQATLEPSDMKLKIIGTTEVTGELAREPMLVQHPDGALFVTGYANTSKAPGLWRSTDMGASWTKLNTETLPGGPSGNSDKDLIIDDQGILYLASMQFGPIDSADLTKDWEGKYIALGVSKDLGESWEWQYLSSSPGDDRPWVAAAGGVIYATWNNREGVFFRKSLDAGSTWSEPVRVHDKGCSSHMAVTPSGKVAIRITPMYQSGYMFDEATDFIAISENEGSSWELIDAPGNAQWKADAWITPDSIPRWVEPLAWTEDGQLVHLWSEGKELYLGISSDAGWDLHQMNTDSYVFFPHITAYGNKLVATWMGLTDRPDPMDGYLALIDLSDNPVIHVSEPLPMRTWGRNNPEERDTGGEYFPAILLQNGNLGAVTTVQIFEENIVGFDWWQLSLKK